jgi:ferric-dicitrate binding protein FerR (iron transport regulator)
VVEEKNTPPTQADFQWIEVEREHRRALRQTMKVVSLLGGSATPRKHASAFGPFKAAPSTRTTTAAERKPGGIQTTCL